MPTGNEIRGAPEVLLTRSDVAELLGVSPTTVTRWAREGRLPCRLTLGGHHRYSSRVIEELRMRLARNARAPSEAKTSKPIFEVVS